MKLNVFSETRLSCLKFSKENLFFFFFLNSHLCMEVITKNENESKTS